MWCNAPYESRKIANFCFDQRARCFSFSDFTDKDFRIGGVYTSLFESISEKFFLFVIYKNFSAEVE